MEILTVCAWTWGDKYGPEYIKRLAAGVARHLRQPFRFRVFTPQEEDLHLTKIPGCFARLRMFDRSWQAANEITNRLVCMDLDMVITGPLDDLFDRPEPFVILQGANQSNPCPFNGSVMMLRAGAHPEVWSDFSVDAARGVPFDSFPDDQGWLAHKLPGAAGWKCGSESGIYAFRKRSWPKSDALPSVARIVAFPGHRDPSQFTRLDWVRDNWAA
ncbi:hypothetical protein [Bradyrhizobium prioriisuperbiae]|uniref:hypothetical protein n=1 Tax=Bradyrhizobium prioriisuperbiae TaxID=2854389 RepID=UPI0028E3DEF9|nr:hypothetical protein [Bradyrhizobium prioritasuperba]